MDLRLSELEKRAFTEIDGEITLRIAEAGDGPQTPVPSVRLSQLQRDAFTMVDGEVAVRVSGDVGGGSCTLETNLSDTLFGWDNSGSVNRNFNIDNTGFQWNLQLTDTKIIALCENTLVTPLPTTTSGMGTLSIDTITLAGTDIKSLTSVDTTTANTIKLNYDTRIVNPNVTSTNTFEIKLNLVLTSDDGEATAIPELTRTLIYLPLIFNLAASTPNFNFDTIFNTGTATQSFPRGLPSEITQVRINNTNQTLPAVTDTSYALAFPSLNRFSSNTERTLSVTASFINATNSAITPVTQTTIMPITIEFPIYLGSVTTTAGLNTNDVNDTSLFTVVGTFTSRPGSMNFTWPANSNPIKVFGIADEFFNGMINFKANSSSVVGNVQSSFARISTGVSITQRANYNYYEAQDGQPGGVTLFVEFL